ncbi:MAG TPA: thiamine phosphate synthase [Candidatus Gastranaerophilales bacterium]|nr:thiamine phosphate synthase [Candidatus Gastranaerophilales bacterium]
MKRIIDVNLNRATEALRVLEEISRFILNNEKISSELKNLRHELFMAFNFQYADLLKSRNTEEDVGREMYNSSVRNDIIDVHKANFKRLQQALRSLSEYSQAENMDISVLEKTRYESYTLEKKMFEELSQKFKKKRLENRNLYLVTDRSGFNNQDDFLNAIAASLKGGVEIVQLREKTANAKEIIEIGKKVRDLCAVYDALFIINDRIDIALALEADGVHLGQDDIDVKTARNILGNDVIIGLSTHAPEQAQKSINSEADYIGIGPVYTTPTKPGRKSTGLEYVKWASENIKMPWFAIGGIDTETVSEVVKAGASRIAVVRAIINAKNPEAVSQKFLEYLTRIAN